MSEIEGRIAALLSELFAVDAALERWTAELLFDLPEESHLHRSVSIHPHEPHSAGLTIAHILVVPGQDNELLGVNEIRFAVSLIFAKAGCTVAVEVGADLAEPCDGYAVGWHEFYARETALLDLDDAMEAFKAEAAHLHAYADVPARLGFNRG